MHRAGILLESEHVYLHFHLLVFFKFLLKFSFVSVSLFVCVHVHTAYTTYESLNKLQKLTFSFSMWVLGIELRS